jgi:hypothetical protein
MAKTRECHVILVRSWSLPLFGFQDARLDRAVRGGIALVVLEKKRAL